MVRTNKMVCHNINRWNNIFDHRMFINFITERIEIICIVLFIGKHWFDCQVNYHFNLYYQNSIYLILFPFMISINSTMFLLGPMSQLRRMFKPTRIIATVLLFLFILLTILSGVWWQKVVLALLFCVCQILSFIWYALSYVPYARDFVKNTFTACV